MLTTKLKGNWRYVLHFIPLEVKKNFTIEYNINGEIVKKHIERNPHNKLFL